MPVVGKNMLIVLPFGWVICGHVAKQIEPRQFLVTDASVICRTGDVPWDELASGRGDRTKPTYRKWGDVYIGPEFVISTEWVGDLP